MQAQPSNTISWYGSHEKLTVTPFAAHAVCACAQLWKLGSTGPCILPPVLVVHCSAPAPPATLPPPRSPCLLCLLGILSNVCCLQCVQLVTGNSPQMHVSHLPLLLPYDQQSMSICASSTSFDLSKALHLALMSSTNLKLHIQLLKYMLTHVRRQACRLTKAGSLLKIPLILNQAGSYWTCSSASPALLLLLLVKPDVDKTCIAWLNKLYACCCSYHTCQSGLTCHEPQSSGLDDNVLTLVFDVHAGTMPASVTQCYISCGMHECMLICLRGSVVYQCLAVEICHFTHLSVSGLCH